MKRLVIVSVLVLVAVGCASIMHGTRQEVGVTSTPSGARVFDNGTPLGTTPAVVNLKRRHNHIVRVELDGYQPFEIALTRHVTGWIWGNIFFGGLVGFVIDAADGAIYQLEPENIVAALGKDAAAQALSRPTVSADDQLLITVTLHADPNWHQIGTLRGQ